MAKLLKILWLASWILLFGCKKEPTPLEKLGVSEEEAKAILKKLAEASAHPPSTATPERRSAGAATPRASATQEAKVPEPATFQDTDPSLLSDRWIVDGLVDIAPAGPSSAHALGVFMVTDQHALLHARLGTLPRGKTPAPSPIAELPNDSALFEVGKGPSFSARSAYWVSHRQLYRHGLESGASAQVIATDARIATRVSALTSTLDGEARDLVAYIALPTEPDGPLIAKLWVEGAEPLLLTEEGAAALSVQVSDSASGLVAYSLEGRTGMSILHARAVSFKEGRPQLGKDEVVWVGGGATSTTELRVTTDASRDVFGLLPIEQDTLHFGMAVLALKGASTEVPASNQWALYPNGMDYAPTAAAVVCGGLSVVFARPGAAVAHAPQELVLAELAQGRLSHELVLSRSKVFFDASIAAVPSGALVSYVADRRTWGRTVRCIGR